MDNEEKFSKKKKGNFSQNFDGLLERYRLQIFFLLTGIIFVLLGIFLFKNSFFSNEKIEIVSEENESGEVVVEIAGEVIKPGVYKLSQNARIEDLIIASGGITADADRKWMDKNLNRAAKLSDGQKIYIPNFEEQSDVLSASNDGGYQNISSDFSGQGSGFMNINTATQKELESLSGIGPVYAQRIIEHRPYSKTEEIISQASIPKATFEKIKDQITAF